MATKTLGIICSFFQRKKPTRIPFVEPKGIVKKHAAHVSEEQQKLKAHYQLLQISEIFMVSWVAHPGGGDNKLKYNKRNVFNVMMGTLGTRVHRVARQGQ